MNKRLFGIFRLVTLSFFVFFSFCAQKCNVEVFRNLEVSVSPGCEKFGSVTLETRHKTQSVAIPGETVRITVSLEDGYEVDYITCVTGDLSWEAGDIQFDKYNFNPCTEIYKFIMPDKDVSLQVHFVKKDLPPKFLVKSESVDYGIKLLFENIPEGAVRRYIYLGESLNEKENFEIDCAGPFCNASAVNESSFYFPFTVKGKYYNFTIVYYSENPLTEIGRGILSVRANGGTGDIDVSNKQRISFNVDDKGVFSYSVKPNVRHNFFAYKKLTYYFHGFDASSSWKSVDKIITEDIQASRTEEKPRNETIDYDSFNLIDYLCEYNQGKNRALVDHLVTKKGLYVNLDYEILDSDIEQYFPLHIFVSDFWENGIDGKGVLILNPSPLLGTWLGNGKQYTFKQNEVIIEDPYSVNVFPYSWDEKYVTINEKQYRYQIDSQRVSLEFAEPNENFKTYLRTDFGKKYEKGNEIAEVRIKDNVLEFVTAPGTKTIPSEATGYRIIVSSGKTETEEDEVIATTKIFSLKQFSEINLDEVLWSVAEKIKNNRILVQLRWAGCDGFVTDNIEQKDFKISDDYKKMKALVDGVKITYNTPSRKFLSLYPEADHYEISAYTIKGECIGKKDYPLVINSLQCDLAELLYGNYETITEKKVRICLKLYKEGESSPENLLAEISENQIVPFDYLEFMYRITTSAKVEENRLLEEEKGVSFINVTGSNIRKYGENVRFAVSIPVELGYVVKEVKAGDKILLPGSDGFYQFVIKADTEISVSFTGYPYRTLLREYTRRIDQGISIMISNIPEKADKLRVYLELENVEKEILNENPESNVHSVEFFYSHVDPGVPYKVWFEYSYKDIEKDIDYILSKNSIEIIPRGGEGML
ncbi:MAG: hypothetical protein MJ182_07395 [Treponema sp.]|nr:hypothetical protein [Treponema sp.]